MDNYICINGKKAELTEEQLKALGIELPKPKPFERVCSGANEFYSFYYISSTGSVCECVDSGFSNGNGTIDLRYRTGNYCTDKAILEQRALHETLNRLLWRYSMEHKAKRVDKKVWQIHKREEPLITSLHNRCECYKVGWTSETVVTFGSPVFDTEEIAQAALKEIFEPFMKAHPEFKF